MRSHIAGAWSTKAVKFPSPPLSKGEWGDLARGAYTGVREPDKGPTRLREIAMAGRERQLDCRPKPWRRMADFFNILLEVHSQADTSGVQSCLIYPVYHRLPIVGNRSRLIQLVHIGEIQSNGFCDGVATLP